MTNNQWFSLTVKERQNLIKEAGYPSNSYAFRVFDHLPYSVKMDIAYVIYRQKQKAQSCNA